MALFFAPVANVVLSSVRDVEQGQASGANNAIRELGGVLGVAVLASIFAHEGGYTSADTFVNGMNAAVYVGAAIVAIGSIAAFAIRRSRARGGARGGVPDARAGRVGALVSARTPGARRLAPAGSAPTMGRWSSIRPTRAARSSSSGRARRS